MGIYLGNVGNIELTRKSLEGSKESIVNPSDVNASRDRFSFDFDPSYLIGGDLVEIATRDGTTLDFVDASGWANRNAAMPQVCRNLTAAPRCCTTRTTQGATMQQPR